MNKQTPPDLVYEAQALTEEIAALTDDIHGLAAQRETLVKRLEQLTSGHQAPPVTLHLVPGNDAAPPSTAELPYAGACG